MRGSIEFPTGGESRARLGWIFPRMFCLELGGGIFSFFFFFFLLPRDKSHDVLWAGEDWLRRHASIGIVVMGVFCKNNPRASIVFPFLPHE